LKREFGNRVLTFSCTTLDHCFDDRSPKMAILALEVNENEEVVSIQQNEKISWRLIHAKLGHIRKASLRAMAKHGSIMGLNDDMVDWNDTQSCPDCARANIRQHRLPRHSEMMELEPFQKGFVDLYGPVNPPSIGNNRYAMIYCDMKSSFGMINLTRDKELSSIESSFKTWILSVNKMGFNIELINGDSDSIFENEKLVKYLNDHQIMLRYAPPGQHGKNGVIERMIQTITAMSRVMLLASGLSKRMWSYSLTYALLIYNAVIKTKFKSDEDNKYLSPYTIISKNTPVFNFPIFGCEIVARNPKALELPKLHARGRRGAFLGFDGEHDNCVVYLNLETNTVLFTDDYVLFEDYYGATHKRTDYYGNDQTVSRAYKNLKLNQVHPFKHGINIDGEKVRTRENLYVPRDIDEDDEDQYQDNVSSEESSYDSDTEYWHDPEVVQTMQSEYAVDYSQDTMDQSEDEESIDTSNNDDTTGGEELNINFLRLRVGDKATKRDQYDKAMDVLLNGYNIGYKESDILEPILLYSVSSRIVNNQVFTLPQTLTQAMSSSSWIPGFRNSTFDELESIFSNNTFEHKLYELSELPDGTKPVDQKWIFDVKNHADGTIKRFKSRLVTRGFMQIMYQSYIDTYSPTALKDSVRIVLALSAMYDLMNFQWDFKTAFLNAELSEDEVIYSPVFEGYELFDIYEKYLSESDCIKLRNWIKKKDRKLFLRMKKSAYGTKQASRTWYLTLNRWMNNHGYESVCGDPSLYIKRVRMEFIIIAIYVDDIFGTSTDPSEVRWLFTELNKTFVVNDLGRIHQCLGMVVNYTDDGIILNNEVYIDNLLREFEMVNCKVVDTPGIPNQYFGPADVATRENLDPELKTRFRSLIGSLMFEAISWRYDIEMKVCHLARFVEFPTVEIYKAGLRILRYLKRTANYGLKFNRVQHYDGLIQPILIASSDSNYAADKDGVSISSYVLQLSDKYYWDHLNIATPVKWNVISYASRRQREVTRSSSEAEYIAAALCLKNILHKKYIMEELGFPQVSVPMFIDNTAVKFMANEWRVTENSKHINTRYHFLRYHAIKETIGIYYVDSEENIADIGTKPLSKQAHEYLMSKFMEGSPRQESREGNNQARLKRRNNMSDK